METRNVYHINVCLYLPISISIYPANSLLKGVVTKTRHSGDVNLCSPSVSCLFIGKNTEDSDSSLCSFWSPFTILREYDVVFLQPHLAYIPLKEGTREKAVLVFLENLISPPLSFVSYSIP